MPVAKRKFYVYKNGRYYEGSFNDGTVADDYDSTDTYSVGDLVLYEGALYKCKTAVSTAEAFDSTKWDEAKVSYLLDEKQDVLVSGTNIKTINNTSLLGSGDIAIQSTLVSGTNIKTVNSTSLLGSGDVAVQPTLVSGTNIKTINSTSLLGSGDIPITASDVGAYSKSEVDTKLNSYLKQSDLPYIPTKTSDLVNNSGFLTSHQDISGLAAKGSANTFSAANTFLSTVTLDGNSEWGDTPALIFKRGELTGAATDYRIYDSGGNLYFDFTNSSNNWETGVRFDTNNLYVKGNKVITQSDITDVSVGNCTYSYDYSWWNIAYKIDYKSRVVELSGTVHCPSGASQGQAYGTPGGIASAIGLRSGYSFKSGVYRGPAKLGGADNGYGGFVLFDVNDGWCSLGRDYDKNGWAYGVWGQGNNVGVSVFSGLYIKLN